MALSSESATESRSPTSVGMEDYLTAHQLAEKLQVSSDWIYDLASSGAMPSYRIGTIRRFHISEIEEWLQRHREPRRLACTPVLTSAGMEDFLTAHQLAEKLQVSPDWIYDLASRGCMPSYRIGTIRRFRISEIKEWLQGHREPRSPGRTPVLHTA
jgi:excisionase family DNA binding protein